MAVDPWYNKDRETNKGHYMTTSARQQDFQDLIKKLDRKEQVSWVPACGGTEVPVTKSGVRYLYMFNTYTRQHAYYCLDTDLFLSQKECEQVGF